MQSLLRLRARRTASVPHLIPVLVLVWSALFVSNARGVTNVPENPEPADGSTKQSIVTWLSCNGTGAPVHYDIYWGTSPNPPIAAIDVEPNPYGGQVWWAPTLHGYTMAYATTYYWRVAVHDPGAPEITGPVWSYTTKAVNEPPNAPLLISPADGATGLPVNPTLRFYLTDFEGSAVNYDLYLGTDANPPLVANHQVGESYKPLFVLAPSTVYYWRLVLRDFYGLETNGPTWTFTTANTANQMPDAPSHPYPQGYLDPAAPAADFTWQSTDPDGDPLEFDVYLGTFYPDTKHPLVLLGTTSMHQMHVQLNPNVRYYWTVVARDAHWSVKAFPEFWQFDNGYVPVLFSRFDAKANGSSVDVHWQLQSDETMESYTLYRREGNSERIAVASAPVQGVEGSYVDKAVAPGKTYRYELLVRTTDGDEFRSPVATVTTAALRLTLYQNVPNPFNPVTTIRYDLADDVRVRLEIIDVSGRHVRTVVDEIQTAGARSAVWNGRDDAGNTVSSGVYFYVLDAGKQRLTRKLVLLK